MQTDYVGTSESPGTSDSSSVLIYVSGAQFREEWFNSTPGITPEQRFRVITAFNGRLLQQTNESLKSYTRKTVDTADAPCPDAIENCYHWYFKRGQDKTWTNLKSDVTLANAIGRSHYQSQVSDGGSLHDVIEFVHGTKPDGTKVVYVVHFARDLHHLPVKWSRFDGGQLVVDLRVTKHKTFEVDGDRLILPLEVKVVYKKESGSRERNVTLTLHEPSLRINESIDDDLFTLPAHGAEIVENFDRLPKPAASSQGRITAVIVGIVVVAFALLVRFFALRRQAN